MVFEKHIRKMEERDWPAFSEFVKEHFHGNYILLNRKFMEWQYGGEMLILELGGKVMGFSGVIPLKMKRLGESVDGVCLANLMTHRLHRNSGMGADLVRVPSSGQKIAYASGHNQVMARVYDRLGWHSNIPLRRFVMILNKEKVDDLIEAAKGKPAQPEGK